MLSVELEGVQAVQERLARLTPALRDAFATKLTTLGQRLADKLRDELSGPMLRARSGLLRNSVTVALSRDGDAIGALASLGEGVPYAAIQIEGGKIAAREILARNGRVLRFMIDGRPVFARSVRLPAVTIPPHPVLEAAMDDLGRDISAEMAEVLPDTLGASP